MRFWPFSNSPVAASIEVDFHSHLLPSVDDGVSTLEESLTVLRGFAEAGYKKVITTPHIYPEVYPNQEPELIKKHEEVKKKLDEEQIDLVFELGAEYFLCDELLSKVKSGVDLLAFGVKKYVLIETGFHQRPLIWEELFFELQVRGYQPILAHPERYAYVSDQLDLVNSWRDQGIKMQLNIPSLLGRYGKAVQRTSKLLIEGQLVDFLCSDLHGVNQLDMLIDAPKNKLFRQASYLVQNNAL